MSHSSAVAIMPVRVVASPGAMDDLAAGVPNQLGGKRRVEVSPRRAGQCIASKPFAPGASSSPAAARHNQQAGRMDEGPRHPCHVATQRIFEVSER